MKYLQWMNFGILMEDALKTHIDSINPLVESCKIIYLR